VGLREEKKRRTRRELADAALRLFDERGYAATGVSDIAAAAGVSTRTFFSYFPSKEDVLFADTDQRLQLMRGLLHDPPPDTTPIGAFRAIIDLIFAGAASDLVGAHQAPRLRLLLTHPELQGGALRRLLAAQQQIAHELASAYDLEESDAVTITSATVGALVGVALRGMRRRDDAETMRADMHRALNQLEQGLGAPAPASSRDDNHRAPRSLRNG
jgi:AcrR family transcriptional regulator